MHGQNNLLSKTPSSAHVPILQKAKNCKRIYGCFDSSTAAKMFGYRVQFNRVNQSEMLPKYDSCQQHKPIHKFANEIVTELVKAYDIIPKYYTFQKIIIPIIESSSSETEEIPIDETDE